MNRTAWIIVIAVIILALILGGIGVLVYLRSRSKVSVEIEAPPANQTAGALRPQRVAPPKLSSGASHVKPQKQVEPSYRVKLGRKA